MIPEINGSYSKTGKSFTFPLTVKGSAEELSVFEERVRSLESCREFIISDHAEYEIIFIDAPAGRAGAYSMMISENSTEISASDREGRASALTTLYCLIRDNDGVIACGNIADEPGYTYRGFLLDCSRHFFTADIVKRMIDEASVCKLNRFHWHISDDQGYRLESRLFPELNTISSFRDDPVDGEHYGGFYTFDEVRDIVSYASLRGIEVIPEIDMPGHISGILRAHPEFSCSGEVPANITGVGIFDNILCAGNDEAIAFIKRLLDEVCELFPYEEFHIGGDEAPKTQWKKCEKCQSRIKELGLKDEEDLQAWFSNQIADYLISKGKRPICWNEALKSDRLDERVCIQYWDHDKGEKGRYCSERLRMNYEWIYSYTHAFYFDFEPALCPMRKMAKITNAIRGGEIIPEDKLRGYECTLWSEGITTEERLHNLSFPRMFAMAEAAWKGSIDYDEFLNRCALEVSHARANGIHALTIEEADPLPAVQKKAVIAEWGPRIKMVKEMGMTQYLHAVKSLIRDKLSDCLAEEDIAEILEKIM